MAVTHIWCHSESTRAPKSLGKLSLIFLAVPPSKARSWIRDRVLLKAGFARLPERKGALPRDPRLAPKVVLKGVPFQRSAKVPFCLAVSTSGPPGLVSRDAVTPREVPALRASCQTEFLTPPLPRSGGPF